MKRIFAIILTILLTTVAMQGCVQPISTKKGGDDSSGELVNKEGLFLIEDSADNLISIQMPGDSRISNAQRELIHEFIHSKIVDGFGEDFALMESENDILDKSKPYTNCYIEAQSRIECYSETVVSVVVEGLYNKKSAAHPIDFLWGINYNPKTLEIVSFTQLFQVDAELYRVFSETARSDIIASCDGKWPTGWGDFSEAICSENRFLSGLSPKGDFEYYFSEYGVVVSVPAFRVIRGHIEVLLPYNILTAVD